MDEEVYAIRIHDCCDEDGSRVATIMRADDVSGPWHDMVSGHPDWCAYVMDALWLAQWYRKDCRIRMAEDGEARRG